VHTRFKIGILIAVRSLDLFLAPANPNDATDRREKMINKIMEQLLSMYRQTAYHAALSACQHTFDIADRG
jgi:hypothetical protein